MISLNSLFYLAGALSAVLTIATWEAYHDKATTNKQKLTIALALWGAFLLFGGILLLWNLTLNLAGLTIGMKCIRCNMENGIMTIAPVLHLLF